MRVLVDTSVWSLSLRKKSPSGHPAVNKLTNLLESGEETFLTGLILQEILQAFKTDAAFSKIRRYLEPFPILEMHRDDYIASARLYRICASKGIVTSTADCQIAAAAIRNGCNLLTTDVDFRRIARVSDLKLM